MINRLPRLFLCNRLVIKLNYDIIQYPDEKEFMAFTDLIMRPNIDYLKYETKLNETNIPIIIQDLKKIRIFWKNFKNAERFKKYVTKKL